MHVKTNFSQGKSFGGGGGGLDKGVRFSVRFHFMFVYYTFSSVWVVEWPPFGK